MSASIEHPLFPGETTETWTAARSRLTDHQACALADQIYNHLDRTAGDKQACVDFGHQVANLVDVLAAMEHAVAALKP